METRIVQDGLPPVLDSTSDPPHIFDGTTRLYITYTCPYAQRAWIARNFKGLQDQIKLVPIDLSNKPAWYKEKVYPTNKDPIKREFGEELLSYAETLIGDGIASLKGDAESEPGASFDYLEEALSKFDDGPFFLGQFSLVDIAYAPSIERFHPLILDVKKYDITTNRPKLTAWIEEVKRLRLTNRRNAILKS